MYRGRFISLWAIVTIVTFLGQNCSGKDLTSRESYNLNSAEEQTTTISQFEEIAIPECITNKGEAGECLEFEECYPMLAFNFHSGNNESKNFTLDDDFIESSYENLQDEVFAISGTEACASKYSSKVCCIAQKPSEDDGSNSSEEALRDESIETEITNLLPVSCGISKTDIYSLERDMHFKQTKVTGGKISQPGQFPWMVAIFAKNGKQTCGASILNNEFLLTAAHCLFTYNSNDVTYLKVHLGDYNIMSLKDGPHETRKISKIILHKGFNSKNYHNDIALMKLDSPVNFTDKIQPICLPNEDFNNEDVEGKTVVVTGWGRDRQRGSPSAVLKLVEMPVWKFKECQKVFNTFAPNRLMEFSNICAGDGRRNKDACIGDSGGSLALRMAFRWTQLGVVSWGKGCGNFPGVYTSTREYIGWIKKNIKNNSN